MMQKEEKIVLVLLVMAALSLIIGYWGFSSPAAAAYSTGSKLGESVYVEGTILEKQMTRTGDNLILTLSNLNIKVFVSKADGAKEVYDTVKTGDKVRITGKVQEYKNAREIVVKSAKDIGRI